MAWFQVEITLKAFFPCNIVNFAYTKKRWDSHLHDVTNTMKLTTPYYLINESKLLKNLKIIKRINDKSGAKSVLALKCFSSWGVFDLMKKYMDGTTSSSLYETRLGYEKLGKETHAYCVGFSKEDIKGVKKYADKIIFNSISQLKMFKNQVKGKELGLRVK